MGAQRVRRVKPARVLSWVLLILVVLWSIGPIYIVLSSALKLPKDIFSYPPSFWPHAPTLENFVTLFHDWPTFPHALGNSAVVALGTVVVTVTMSLLAAFAFSRFRSRTLRRGAVGMIAVRMFPPIIISIPLFPMLNAIGLADTRITLIMLYSTFQVTMITWIMKGFIDSIPMELEEAALVDGASGLGVFVRVILPLCAPVIVAAAILSGSYAWNEFQFGFLFTATRAETTPVLIHQMLGSLTGVQWGNVFAGSVVQFVPALLFLWSVQRYLIRGMTAGAVKG